MKPAWEFEHVVEVNASARAAWEFWTHVENWSIDPAIEWVKLDGAFEAGATGETKQKGFPPLHWRVVESRAPARGVIEIETPGATARFVMDFEPVSDRTSRLRQRITLEGEGAEALAAGLGAEFEDGIRQGMRRLADAIARDAEEQQR